LAAGAHVTIAACDVADRDALERLFASLGADHPLTGVIHTAGVIDDGTLRSLTDEQLHRVLRPKVDGAIHLHELTRGLDLSIFVLFSSLSGVLGSPAQANYAAANTFLDALSSKRRALGLSALSLAWGPWAEAGLFARLSEADRDRMRRQGVPPLPPQDGLALFDIALGRPEAFLVATRFDAARVSERTDTVPPLLRELVRAPAGPPRPIAAGAGSLSAFKQRLVTMSEADRGRHLLDLVRAEVSTALGLPTPDAIEPNRSFQELGLDSLMTLELKSRLGAATGLRLPDALLFDQPTVAKTATWLFDQLGSEPSLPEGPPAESRAQDPAPGAPDAFAGAEREKVLVSMFRQTPDELGNELLSIAARIRHARQLEGPSHIGAHTPSPERLASGTTKPALICFPAIVPGGPLQYARFAAALRERHDVWALHNPGFAKEDILPKDLASLVEHHAEAVQRCADGAPFALAGASTGGWVAHLVASHLERIGISPTAVVLLDTYMNDRHLDSLINALRQRWLKVMAYSPELSSVATIEDELIAMNWYRHIFEGWTPARITTPVLLVRATSFFERNGDDSPDPSDHSWRTNWDQFHSVVDVPGDHFTMMTDHADITARAVHSWLAALPEKRWAARDARAREDLGMLDQED
jgi:thioesterase domain-containing protein/acyl carrier protein